MLVRFWNFRYSSMVMKVCGILVMVTTLAPKVLILVVTKRRAPLVRVTTIMSEATAITTPITVRIERSLFAQRDCSATLKASENCMADPIEYGIATGVVPGTEMSLGPK